MKHKKLPVFSAGARYSTNCILSFLYLSGTDSLPWSDFIKEKCAYGQKYGKELILCQI
jgi:hypothetical protein